MLHSMLLPTRSRVAILTTVALVACSADRTTDRPAEPTDTKTEALSGASFVGTSLPPKTLALTFDDGPGDRAGELSAYLASQGIHAAFFVNGARIAATTLPNPNTIGVTANVDAILAQIVADGHLVANHTVTHRDLVTQVLATGAAKLIQELSETDADIADYVPSNHFLFRAPYGSYSTAVFNDVTASPMNKYVGPIYWDIGGVSTNYPAQAADWACWQNSLQSGGAGAQFGVTTQQCGDAYLSEIGAVGRGIVLMHDPYFSATGNTVDMIKYLVPILKANGYSFVRVDEVPAIAALLPAPPPPPPPPVDAGAPVDASPDSPSPSPSPKAHADAGGTPSPSPATSATTQTGADRLPDNPADRTAVAAEPATSEGGCAVTCRSERRADVAVGFGLLGLGLGLLRRRGSRGRNASMSAPLHE